MLARWRQHFRGQARNISDIIRRARQCIIMLWRPGRDEAPAARIVTLYPFTRDGVFNKGKRRSRGHGDIARLFRAQFFRKRRARHLHPARDHAAIAR